MGDLFFSDRFPFVDTKGGGSVDGYIQNVGKIIKEILADAKITRGHGSLTTFEGLKTFHPMMTRDLRIGKSSKEKWSEIERRQKGWIV